MIDYDQCARCLMLSVFLVATFLELNSIILEKATSAEPFLFSCVLNAFLNRLFRLLFLLILSHLIIELRLFFYQRLSTAVRY